jgi:hypothetical protein
LQRSPAAACSCSQLRPTIMCWPDFCTTDSLVRKIPACLCQVHRLLAADRGWGGASAHLEAEGRRVPTEFLPNSWIFAVGVDQYQGHCEHTCPLTDNAQGSQARLGPRLMPPQSQLLAYGPAIPVNKSVELVLRSRTSRRLRAVQRRDASPPSDASRLAPSTLPVGDSTVCHARPRNKVGDLDSRSRVLTASWLDSEGAG